MSEMGKRNFILRQIQANDVKNKLELNDPAHSSLKSFLENDAFNFHCIEIAKTYVLTHIALPLEIKGFITLMNSTIDFKEEKPEELSKIIYKSFPCVKIARLAIDINLQDQKLGTKLLKWSMTYIILKIMPHVGCRFLVVDSKRESIGFYQRMGFTLLKTQQNNNKNYPLMFYDLHKHKLMLEPELIIQNEQTNNLATIEDD